jgi:hypothetical protein
MKVSSIFSQQRLLERAKHYRDLKVVEVNGNCKVLSRKKSALGRVAYFVRGTKVPRS